MEDALLACASRILVLDVSVPFCSDMLEWNRFTNILSHLSHLICLYLSMKWNGTKRECWSLCNLFFSMPMLMQILLRKGNLSQPWLEMRKTRNKKWTLTSQIESEEESRLFKTTFHEMSFLHGVSREPTIPLHILVLGPVSTRMIVLFSLLRNGSIGVISTRDDTPRKKQKLSP